MLYFSFFLYFFSEKYSKICPLILEYGALTLILLFTTTPTFANNEAPDQMASEEAIRWLPKKPSDQDLHCLSFVLWIWTKTLYGVIWLADSQKWVRLIKLFSRIRVILNLTLWDNSADDKLIMYFSQKTGFDISCKLSPNVKSSVFWQK